MMACNSSLAVVGIVAGVFYAVPKVVTYLCTSPENPDASLWSRLRGRMADFQEQIRLALGERLWFYGADVLAGNAWISVIAILCLTSTPFSSIDKGISVATAFVAFCAEAWLVRYGISQWVPQLAPIIGNHNSG